MFKLFIVGIIAFILGCMYHSRNSVTSDVTYNPNGIKTVIATCDKDKACTIVIGQECEDAGFKVVDIDHDDKKTIMSAECGKPKQHTLF